MRKSPPLGTIKTKAPVAIRAETLSYWTSPAISITVPPECLSSCFGFNRVTRGERGTRTLVAGHSIALQASSTHWQHSPDTRLGRTIVVAPDSPATGMCARRWERGISGVVQPRSARTNCAAIPTAAPEIHCFQSRPRGSQSRVSCGRCSPYFATQIARRPHCEGNCGRFGIRTWVAGRSARPSETVCPWPLISRRR